MALVSYSQVARERAKVIRTKSPTDQLSYVVNRAGKSKEGEQQYSIVFRMPMTMATDLGWKAGTRLDILWDKDDRSGALIAVQRGGFGLSQSNATSKDKMVVVAPYIADQNWPFVRTMLALDNVTLNEEKGLMFAFPEDLTEDKPEQKEKRATPVPVNRSTKNTHTPQEIGAGAGPRRTGTR